MSRRVTSAGFSRFVLGQAMRGLENAGCGSPGDFKERWQ